MEVTGFLICLALGAVVGFILVAAHVIAEELDAEKADLE